MTVRTQWAVWNVPGRKGFQVDENRHGYRRRKAEKETGKPSPSRSVQPGSGHGALGAGEFSGSIFCVLNQSAMASFRTETISLKLIYERGPFPSFFPPFWLLAKEPCCCHRCVVSGTRSTFGAEDFDTIRRQSSKADGRFTYE